MFVDSVFEDFYCKKCNLVARKFTITSCCGESYCHACIADFQKKERPCPACGEKEYTTLQQIKYQKRINCLQVYCSMKERGCDWSGTLEQLDTHLDPDQDNCQYVDTKCPLNCHMTIPKNKVEQHVAQHCAKRPYVCQHCNFKATYEEVVDTHLPECKYVPLQCPNLCGVTFERDFTEDHMKMCRLEEVWCEFSDVGCDGRFKREDQEEHTRQNSQKHLTLTAFLSVETKEQVQQKLLEQNKKHKEEEEKLRQRIEEQEKKIEEQEEKLINQDKQHKEEEQKLEQKIEKQEKKLQEQENKLGEQENKLQEQENKLQEQEEMFEQFNTRLDMTDITLSKLSGSICLNRKFEMKNFSQEKAKDKPNDWFSPAMYTHVCGYKFCIGVDANGYDLGRGVSVGIALYSMPGEYDDQLKWPANAKFTIQLINQQGGENISLTGIWKWKKPIKNNFLDYFPLVFHYKICSFLDNDTLYFYISVVELL